MIIIVLIAISLLKIHFSSNITVYHLNPLFINKNIVPDIKFSCDILPSKFLIINKQNKIFYYEFINSTASIIDNIILNNVNSDIDDLLCSHNKAYILSKSQNTIYKIEINLNFKIIQWTFPTNIKCICFDSIKENLFILNNDFKFFKNKLESSTIEINFQEITLYNKYEYQNCKIQPNLNSTVEYVVSIALINNTYNLYGILNENLKTFDQKKNGLYFSDLILIKNLNLVAFEQHNRLEIYDLNGNFKNKTMFIESLDTFSKVNVYIDSNLTFFITIQTKNSLVLFKVNDLNYNLAFTINPYNSSQITNIQQSNYNQNEYIFGFGDGKIALYTIVQEFLNPTDAKKPGKLEVIFLYFCFVICIIPVIIFSVVGVALSANIISSCLNGKKYEALKGCGQCCENNSNLNEALSSLCEICSAFD